jgi:predicted flap endonuclease-1-like 5' DNA nuclease
MSLKVLYAIYEEGDDLLHAVETVRGKGMDVVDCYTPYPVHGLDNVMGIKRSRLPIAAFCFAMLGLASAISLQYFTMGYDWPMIIGGKPYSGLPSWIPVCFELSILFTAYGMGITFFIKSRMLHGMEADIKDIRQTDNRLVMAIDVSDTDDTSGLESLLKETKATEIKKPYQETVEAVKTETPKVPVEKVKAAPVKKAAPKTKAKSSSVASKKSSEITEEEKGEKINLLLGKIGKASGSVNDDLKLVKGIGPVFERNLNSIGIRSFEQISKMDSETIKLVEEITRYFPGKIERENWIEQALELMKK